MRKLFWLSMAFIFICVSGCGYRFSGGGELPFGITKVFVPMFHNRTSEPQIERIVTNDFIYEFTRSGQINVVEKESADGILLGTITGLRTETVARTGSQTPLERRVRLFLDLRLTDREGNDLWAVRGVSDDETYQVLSEKLATERLKLTAIKRLSKRLAEMVYNRITDVEME